MYKVSSLQRVRYQQPH